LELLETFFDRKHFLVVFLVINVSKTINKSKIREMYHIIFFLKLFFRKKLYHWKELVEICSKMQLPLGYVFALGCFKAPKVKTILP